MITMTEVLIYGLATWRIASLLVKETGPFRMFVTVREWTGIQHYPDDQIAVIPERFLPQLLSCVWCASLWIGLFFFVFYLFTPIFSLQIATIFSFSAVAVIIETYIRK